ncbi:MAG: hypothetical protein V3T72_16370 [Thermoanaerobaculia bacterium]
MNDSRQPDPLRDLCEELAELLATEDGARTARLLQLVGALAPTSSAADPEPLVIVDSETPAAISIWQPEDRDGELIFVRPAAWPLGDHYAARREIPAAKGSSTVRIAFFGESAAAGYLYAPHLTPARVLEARLGDTADGGYEVVDLARTNETLAGLTATVASALQLDPDLLVIFTGNNWTLLETPEVSPYVSSLRARQRYALAARRGPRGPAELARRLLRAKAEAALAEIAALVGERPVIIVVPEVNLADWEDRQPVPWLAGDRTRRWYELYERARRELDEERFADADATADSMTELDGGLCSTGPLLRARALVGSGDLAAAREAFEDHVEQLSYAGLAFLGSPRASRSVQQMLRDACERHSFACVDLPRIFADHCGSPLPGHRLFLDYCHLTREGIEVAMDAVAGEVLRLLSRQPSAGGDSIEFPARVEATARLGAAVHGGHRLVTSGDKATRLEHWLRQALDADPTIAEMMLDLAAARCAPCPPVLTPAQRHALESEAPLLLQHGWRWDHLDADLLVAMSRVLPRGHGIDQRLLESHGVTDRAVDLTRPPYLWEPLERFYPEAMGFDERAFHRSPWPESSFCLIAGGDRDVDLEITLRLPAVAGSSAERSGDAEITVGGEAIGRLSAGETWTRHRLRIGRDLLRRSSRRLPLHRLAIRWPPLPDAGAAARTDAIRRLEHGLEADFHPVFGEVFSLLARSTSALGP